MVATGELACGEEEGGLPKEAPAVAGRASEGRRQGETVVKSPDGGAVKEGGKHEGKLGRSEPKSEEGSHH